MRLSRRILSVIGVMLFLAALLGACGDQATTPVPADGVPGSTQTEAAPPTALPSGLEPPPSSEPGLSPLPTPTDASGVEPDEAPTVAMANLSSRSGS